jgi:glutamine amidotransferase PdxT
MLDKVSGARKDLLREFVGEQMASIRHQADVAQMHIEIRDDAALIYAVKRLLSHVRSMATTAKELQAIDTNERIVAAGHEPEQAGDASP